MDDFASEVADFFSSPCNQNKCNDDDDNTWNTYNEYGTINNTMTNLTDRTESVVSRRSNASSSTASSSSSATSYTDRTPINRLFQKAQHPQFFNEVPSTNESTVVRNAEGRYCDNNKIALFHHLDSDDAKLERGATTNDYPPPSDFVSVQYEPTPLFGAIEAEDWDNVLKFIETNNWSWTSNFTSWRRNLSYQIEQSKTLNVATFTTPAEEQARTWVVRTLSFDDSNASGTILTGSMINNVALKRCTDLGRGISVKLSSIDSSYEYDDVCRLPIHAAILHKASLEVIKALVLAYPKGVTLPDSDGNLALHLVFYVGGRLPLLRLLLDAYPPAINRRNAENLLPDECGHMFEQNNDPKSFERSQTKNVAQMLRICMNETRQSVTDQLKKEMEENIKNEQKQLAEVNMELGQLKEYLVVKEKSEQTSQDCKTIFCRANEKNSTESSSVTSQNRESMKDNQSESFFNERASLALKTEKSLQDERQHTQSILSELEQTKEELNDSKCSQRIKETQGEILEHKEQQIDNQKVKEQWHRSNNQQDQPQHLLEQMHIQNNDNNNNRISKKKSAKKKHKKFGVDILKWKKGRDNTRTASTETSITENCNGSGVDAGVLTEEFMTVNSALHSISEKIIDTPATEASMISYDEVNSLQEINELLIVDDLFIDDGGVEIIGLPRCLDYESSISVCKDILDNTESYHGILSNSLCTESMYSGKNDRSLPSNDAKSIVDSSGKNSKVKHGIPEINYTNGYYYQNSFNENSNQKKSIDSYCDASNAFSSEKAKVLSCGFSGSRNRDDETTAEMSVYYEGIRLVSPDSGINMIQQQEISAALIELSKNEDTNSITAAVAETSSVKKKKKKKQKSFLKKIRMR